MMRSKVMYFFGWIILLLSCLCHLCLAIHRQRNLPKMEGAFATPVASSNTPYHYKTMYYKQKVDHFGFTNDDSYLQRYLLNTSYWSAGQPIFFYTGNEGDITWFCNNSGFIWDIAPQFSAMIVFAEHRYYGKSMPYGASSYKSPKYTDFFTSEQALADFVELIHHIKSSIADASNSPVVAFGGSYGGMLSAWLRMKYPGTVVGAIAASAPIWMFPGMNPCEAFNRKTTEPFTKASLNCMKNILVSWDGFDEQAETKKGLKFVSDTFRLCTPLKSSDDMESLKSWLSDAYTNLAMANYPYPADFLGSLPAWPVKVLCSHLTDEVYEDEALIQHIFSGISVYFNYTGKISCLNIDQSGQGTFGWGYQSCTEMTTPTCGDGIHDMFMETMWNLTSFSESCYSQWGVKPRAHWSRLHYEGRRIHDASNIIFSNGLLDPWSSLGVLESISSTVKAVLIRDGAHHLDLRASNVKDPPSVIAAREVEKAAILKWINA